MVLPKVFQQNDKRNEAGSQNRCFDSCFGLLWNQEEKKTW